MLAASRCGVACAADAAPALAGRVRPARSSPASAGFPARTARPRRTAATARPRREHPAPAVLAVPGLAAMAAAVAPSGTFCAISQVEQLRRQDAEDDGQLVQRYQPTAQRSRGDLGDVHRRQVRGHADGHPARDAPGHESGEASPPNRSAPKTPRTGRRRRPAAVLRPNLSLRAPASSEPARHPSSAQLLAQPLRPAAVVRPSRRASGCPLHDAARAGRLKNGSKNGLAPPITTQSQPKSNPPRAATTEMVQI